MERTFTMGGSDRTEEHGHYMWLKKHLLARGAPGRDLDGLNNERLAVYAFRMGYLTHREVARGGDPTAAGADTRGRAGGPVSGAPSGEDGLVRVASVAVGEEVSVLLEKERQAQAQRKAAAQRGEAE